MVATQINLVARDAGILGILGVPYLLVSPSLAVAWFGLVRPGLSSSPQPTAALSGTEPREKTTILKAGLFQITRIHKGNVSPSVVL